MYDIANVLQSIGLIHKTQMSNSRKPAFKWIGLSGVIQAINEIKELNASMTAYKFPMRIARKEELSPEALVNLLLPA